MCIKRIITCIRQTKLPFFKSRDKLILAGGTIFFLLFNMAPVLAFYQAAIERRDEAHSILMFLHYFMTVTPYYIMISIVQMLFLLSGRVVFMILGPVIFLLSGIIAYYTYYYGVVFTDELVQAIAVSNEREISGFVSNKLWVWLAVVLLVWQILWWFFNKHPHLHPLNMGYFTISILLMGLLVVQVPTGIPFNAIGSFIAYEKTQYELNHLRQKRENIAKYTTGYNKDFLKDLTIILVIGESARADHFHLNGYTKNTTPELEKIPNLVNFSDVESCGNYTNRSVPCMLTRATRNHLLPIYTETSLLSIFKALHFPVIWASNNNSIGEQNVDIKPIATGYDEVTQYISDESGKHPEHSLLHNMFGIETDNNQVQGTDMSVLLPSLNKELQYYPENLLMVLHTTGSHTPYYMGYTEEFARFTPVCIAPAMMCLYQSAINTYDNTILFTDHFLASVINRVKNRKAIVIYVADHGELLGEYGHWGHMVNQLTGPEQYHVPMMWWVSDSLIKSRPDLLTMLRNHKDKHLSHDNLFHSIVDCFGVQSSAVDTHLSLCR